MVCLGDTILPTFKGKPPGVITIEDPRIIMDSNEHLSKLEMLKMFRNKPYLYPCFLVMINLLDFEQFPPLNYLSFDCLQQIPKKEIFTCIKCDIMITSTISSICKSGSREMVSK